MTITHVANQIVNLANALTRISRYNRKWIGEGVEEDGFKEDGTMGLTTITKLLLKASSVNLLGHHQAVIVDSKRATTAFIQSLNQKQIQKYI